MTHTVCYIYQITRQFSGLKPYFYQVILVEKKERFAKHARVQLLIRTYILGSGVRS